MAKRRHSRGAMGVLERNDGVRVAVKNPTVWRHMEQQTHLLESLQAALASVSAERDRRKAAFDQLCANGWVRLGVRLGLVRLDLGAIELRRELHPMPAEPAPVGDA